MTRQVLNSIVLLLLMVAVAVLAVVLRPSQKRADFAPAVKLEQLVPRTIGSWRLDESVKPLQADPGMKQTLRKIYTEVLSRTYVDPSGYRVMLSIAYGNDQSDGLQIHRPEVCYAAQGFNVTGNHELEVATRFGALPLSRLVASQTWRHEPISYWVVVGGKSVHAGYQQRLEKLRSGLSGKVPDGMLIRVSSIDPEDAGAFAHQEKFINDLLVAIADPAVLGLRVARSRDNHADDRYRLSQLGAE